MLGISFILIGLKIILIFLSIKHLNLIKNLIKHQILLYDVLSKIQIDLVKIKSKKVLEEFKAENNNEITHLKSSAVSKKELENLGKGRI